MSATHSHGTHQHQLDAAEGLRAGLDERAVQFAMLLRPVHDALKLATMVSAGATVLHLQALLSRSELDERLREAAQVYHRATKEVPRPVLAPPDGRRRRYLAAMREGRLAITRLRSTLADAGQPNADQIGVAIRLLSAANQKLRRIGETFWPPEYAPSGSEGGGGHLH